MQTSGQPILLIVFIRNGKSDQISPNQSLFFKVSTMSFQLNQEFPRMLHTFLVLSFNIGKTQNLQRINFILWL